MSDLLVSLIESLAGAAAAASERRRAAAVGPSTAPQPQPPPAAVRRPVAVDVRPVTPAPVQPSRPKPAPLAPAPAAHHARSLDIRTMFARRDSLLRTILAGEILGPPRALRGQNLWDGPRV